MLSDTNSTTTVIVLEEVQKLSSKVNNINMEEKKMKSRAKTKVRGLAAKAGVAVVAVAVLQGQAQSPLVQVQAMKPRMTAEVAQPMPAIPLTV